jgi:hypothetical protein
MKVRKLADNRVQHYPTFILAIPGRCLPICSGTGPSNATTDAHADTLSQIEELNAATGRCPDSGAETNRRIEAFSVSPVSAGTSASGTRRRSARSDGYSETLVLSRNHCLARSGVPAAEPT